MSYRNQPTLRYEDETPAEHIRNALAVLVSAAVRESGSVKYDEADVDAVLRRLRAAASKLEKGGK